MDPKFETDFFMPEMTQLGSHASEASDSLPDDMKVSEYMALHGYKRAFEVSMSTGMMGMSFLPEMELNEDGTMTFYLRQRISQRGMQVDQLDMTLHVTMHQAGGQSTYWAKTPLTIQCLPVLEEATSTEGERHVFANSGVAMTNVRLIRTPISTYVAMDAEVVDEAAYDGYHGKYTLSFFSADGVRYDAGPFNLAGFMRDATEKNSEAGELYYMATLTLTEIPDMLMLNEAPWGVHEPEKATDSWVIRLENVE